MIRLGVNIPNFGAGATPGNLRDWARFAEDGGFDLAMMSDHVAPTPDVTALYPTPFYDAFTTLAWLAGLTERIELGTTVAIVPYRHPLLTARTAANIDQFSGGRFVLGVGVGWSEPEFEAVGTPFRERGKVTDEYLAAIIAAWTSDVVSLEGRYARYRAVGTGPRAVRSPHPPVWVGGTAPGAIRRAARFGDAWHPNNAELPWLRDTGLPALRAAAAAEGRPVPQFCPRVRAQRSDRDAPSAGRRIGTGSLAQICDDIAGLVELGATRVVLDTNPDDPRDRRPEAEDWRTLSAIAERLR
jgi:probable F420-dependent oxidoreductase